MIFMMFNLIPSGFISTKIFPEKNKRKKQIEWLCGNVFILFLGRLCQIVFESRSRLHWDREQRITLHKSPESLKCHFCHRFFPR